MTNATEVVSTGVVSTAPSVATSDRVEPRHVSAVVRKVVVALVSGGVAYAITNLSSLEQIWQLVLSSFIGGIILVVQFLDEFEDRLRLVEERGTRRLRSMEEKQAAHNAEIRDLVRQSFSKINRATELFGLVEASALRTDAVIQLVQHATALGPDATPLVARIAQAEIVRTSRFLKELSDGTASYAGEDRDWLLDLTQHARVSIDATSLNTVDARGRSFDSSFWQSDLGQRYLELQRVLVRNGVKIRRIFVVDRPDAADGREFLEMCRMQARIGIEVRILNATRLEGPLKTKLLDFILFDNVVSYEVTPAYRLDESSPPPEVVHTLLQLQPDVVENRIDRYRDFWERSVPFVAAD